MSIKRIFINHNNKYVSDDKLQSNTTFKLLCAQRTQNTQRFSHNTTINYVHNDVVIQICQIQYDFMRYQFIDRNENHNNDDDMCNNCSDIGNFLSFLS